MYETQTILLAGRPVRIDLNDAELAESLRSRSKGFQVSNDLAPWLTITVNRQAERRLDVGGVAMHRDGPHLCKFFGCVSKGELDERTMEASGEVYNDIALFQFLYLCLSLTLPKEGGLLLHADTVEWKGKAYAFLGPSGAGKSTAASQMVVRAGAIRLAEDRTVISMEEGDRPIVSAMPQLIRDTRHVDAPRKAPLAGLVFPTRGKGLEIHPVSGIRAVQGMARSTIFPRGEGQPVETALEVTQKVLDSVWAAEMSFVLGEDFSEYLEATGVM